jgi:hypothetical protein
LRSKFRIGESLDLFLGPSSGLPSCLGGGLLGSLGLLWALGLLGALGFLGALGLLGSSLLLGGFSGSGFLCLLSDLLGLLGSGLLLGRVNFERAGGTSSLGLDNLLLLHQRLEGLLDEGGKLGDIDLVVGADVFLDGGQRGAFSVLQCLDGSEDHDGGWGVGGGSLGLGGLLGGGLLNVGNHFDNLNLFEFDVASREANALLTEISLLAGEFVGR